jgi:hypothetical protein
MGIVLVSQVSSHFIYQIALIHIPALPLCFLYIKFNDLSLTTDEHFLTGIAHITSHCISSFDPVADGAEELTPGSTFSPQGASRPIMIKKGEWIDH